MEITGIIVKYKDYVNGREGVVINNFKTWNENGNYTVFYNDASLDSAELVIPTRNVVSIEFVERRNRWKNSLII